MRVLITGAGGFIGKPCLEAFSEAGWQVRAVSRQTIAKMPRIEPVIVSSLMQNDWKSLLQDVDCVLHLAGVAHRADANKEEYQAINVQVTDELVRSAISAGVTHFVYLSSIAVHGRELNVLTEDTPLQPADINGQSKALAEAKLCSLAKTSSMKWTIIRPPMVYGVAAPGNFRRLVGLVKRGVPLPLAGAIAPRSYVGIENLVSALLCVVGNPKAANRIYLVSDNDDLCTADFVRAMAKGAGKRALLWWLPVWFLNVVASLLGRSRDAERLLGHLRVDPSKILSELGWSPVVTARDGVARAVAVDVARMS